MLQMSFTHDETLILGYTCNVCGKKFKIKWYIKNSKKKAHTFFWFPVKYIKISDNCHKIQKFLRLGFSNHAQRFTPPYYLDVDNPLTFSIKVWNSFW